MASHVHLTADGELLHSSAQGEHQHQVNALACLNGPGSAKKRPRAGGLPLLPIGGPKHRIQSQVGHRGRGDAAAHREGQLVEARGKRELNRVYWDLNADLEVCKRKSGAAEGAPM